ncbi:peptidylprolyl isomerase [Aeoliella sp. SH292]|uniref:peptidylprolyl isomerase n=1 Tax=Aeoliella sp. SH292 TaxID=3454464 RepID=UPI003F9D9729
MKRSHWYKYFRRPTRTRESLRQGRQLQCQSLEARWMMAVDSFGDEALVNDLVARTQSTGDAQTAVAISELGRVVVFSGNGPGDQDGVFVKRYDADGDEVGSAVRVNTTFAGLQHSASVAMDDDGSFVVVWAGRGVGDKQGVFFQRFSAAGAKVGSETLVNTTVAGKQLDPVIAMNADGAFAIGWSGQSTSDASGVYLQRFTAAGVKAGSEVLVNTTTANHQHGLAMVYDSAGNLVTAWSSLKQDGSDWGVYGQRFSSTGARLGNQFAWNTTTTNSQTNVSLAAGPDGEVVAAWQSRAQDGSGWGVYARRLSSNGTTFGNEVRLNDTTAGQQFDPKIGIAEDGTWLATWTTGTTNGAGWEVRARTFTNAGAPESASFAINQDLAGANSGHQQHASLAMIDDKAIIVWSGAGQGDRRGVFLQEFDVDLIDDGPQAAPNLAAIPNGNVEVGQQIQISITATDANSRDELTFQLDPDNSPAGATIEKTGERTAIIRWIPTAAFENQTVNFRVLVIDDGEPPLVDSEEFTVTVGNAVVAVDLNGSGVLEGNVSAVFEPQGGPTVIVDPAIVITGANGGTLTGATVTMAAAPDGNAEILAVNVLDTDITATYNPTTRTLTLTGEDTVENYTRVLKTLTYNNTASAASGARSITVNVTDEDDTSTAATISLTIGTIDLVALAQALNDAGAKFFGAAWCPFCTAQKEMFEDGGQLLPFVEVTSPDRTLTALGETLGIDTFPTWIFANGTRLEGIQSLQVLAAAAGVLIPVGDTPFLADIPDDILLVGSPLHIPLDGYDPEGGPLTYTITTSNPGVAATLLTGNRSMRVNVAGFGDMVFQLFEDRASRATDQVIELAESNFYDNVKFHRILNNFVIQGGDPTGTGSGGSTLGDFDDQFHLDLQHNRTGLLSYAKSSDDTNDSQFFITEGGSASLRNLDFNHTVFGILVEGEANRAAISDTAVVQQPTSSEVSKPAVDIVMESVDIFTDTENAVMMLKADSTVTGPVDVTVTVTNSKGETFQRTFTVNVQNDTVNGRPFLNDIAPVSIVSGNSAQIQLGSQDAEGDPVVYEASKIGNINYTYNITPQGLLTVTPPSGFTGIMEIGVLVRRETPTSSTDFDTQIIRIEVTAPVGT